MPAILSRITLPPDLIVLMDVLNARGYESYLVGGCVRDILLGKTPHDYDVTTQATPEQIKELFPHTIDTGIQHGTVTVVMSDGQYEVTTMRTESTYSDSRHPDSVEFVTNIEQDLARRDFTMNAIAAKLFVDPHDTPHEILLELIDPFNGSGDLNGGLVKCVGNPDDRFCEDPLRILRALRFAVSYDLTIDVATETAIHINVRCLRTLSAERIQSELRKIFTASYDRADFGLLLFDYIDVWEEIVPEFCLGHGFQQHSPYHSYTVQEHCLYSIVELYNVREYLAEFSSVVHDHWFELCMTMLLHDISKPQCFTQDENDVGHFYGHAHEGAELADAILRRLKFSNAERERIVLLIDNHDRQFEPGTRYANRLLADLGKENAQLLMAVRFADLYAHGVDYSQFGEMNSLRKAQLTYLYLAIAVFEDRKLSIKDLNISGNDLIKAGYTPGPVFKSCLSHLLDEVINGNLKNSRIDLLIAAKHYMEEYHA